MAGRTEKLKIKNISKVFVDKKGSYPTIDNVSFDVYDGEFLVLLGPGLCGKTVLLNIIAGLEPATEGEIFLDGKKIEGTQSTIGMVFQKKAIFPWKTVMQNVEFGLKMRGIKKTERREIAQKFISLVGLDNFENSYPHELSGGMKQRVGIARAYANDPEVLILDEPFGALDAQTRYAMQDEIIRIWESEKKTIIFITNNIEEALYLGDRIVLLSKCPAQVKEIYPIHLPRPRDILSTEFLNLREQISSNMDIAL